MSTTKQDTALVTYTDTSKESDVEDIKNGNCEPNDQKDKSVSTDVSVKNKEQCTEKVNDEDPCEGKGVSNDEVNKEDTCEGNGASNDEVNKEDTCKGNGASNDGNDNNKEVQDEDNDEPWYINYKGEDCSEELFDDYGSEEQSTTDEESSEKEEIFQDEDEGQENESSSEVNTDKPGIWCGRQYYSYRFGQHLSYSMSNLDTRLATPKSRYEYKGRTVDDINVDYYRKNRKFADTVLRTDFVCEIMSQNS